MSWSLPITVDLKKTDLYVLAWNNHYFGTKYFDPVSVSLPDGNDITLRWTTNREHIRIADAVWFHCPTIQDMPKLADKVNPWILMSMESEANFPAMSHSISRAAFDIFMTYRLSSDIPCPYPNWSDYGALLDPPPQRHGIAKGALAVYIASHPVEYRDNFVRKLMRHISVDCLGKCLQNREITEFVEGGTGSKSRDSILKMLPKYKFYLALENSICPDYVTEKVFQALNCGTVPIYLGAENIREFAPADEAVIVASDYESPASLAKYLQQLDEDDVAYQRHLAWKHNELPKKFEALLNLGSIDPRKRLAVKLAHGCDYQCRCGGRLSD